MKYFVRFSRDGKFTTAYKATDAEGFELAKATFKVVGQADWDDVHLLVVEAVKVEV